MSAGFCGDEWKCEEEDQLPSDNLGSPGNPSRQAPFHRDFVGHRHGWFSCLFFRGSPLRLVLAKSRSCFWLIDSYICLEAPFNEDLLLLPRFAASAAPAAFCCCFDFAGMEKSPPLRR